MLQKQPITEKKWKRQKKNKKQNQISLNSNTDVKKNTRSRRKVIAKIALMFDKHL